MNNIFYVYKLKDPDTDIPFYIGKGCYNRMYDHEKEVRRDIIPHKNKHLYYKIKKLLENNKQILYEKIIENIDEDIALEIEEFEIKNIGRNDLGTGPLCNMTDGGEGTSKLIYTDDEKLKRSLRIIGDKNPMYGKHHSNKSKQIISEKRKNRNWNFKHSNEHKNNLRLFNPGGISTSKKVFQLNDNNQIIQMWKSLSFAAKSIGVSKGNICSAIKNNWRCRGYKWKYE